MSRVRLLIITALLAVVSGCGQDPVNPSDAAAVATSGSDAANGGNKPTTIPAEVTFRCNDDSCASTDRLRGDGRPYPAVIGTDGNLMLQLPDASRFITYDYSVCVEPCAAGRRWFATYQAGGGQELLIHNSTLVPGTESETPRGLLDIPVGATWASRIKMGYKSIDPTGIAYTWGNRFNPFYPGSTNLSVTRVSDSEWHIEATPAQRLWSASIGGPTKRTVTEVFEGNYVLPFKIIVKK